MGNEHITLKLGLNKQEFEKGLAGARSLISGFKEALAGIGIGIGLKSLTDFAAEISDTSETLGVSTDFLQGWRYAATQSGVSAEKASTGLERFIKQLAESGKAGADVEYEINSLADRLKDTEDPVKRVQMAVEAFGKSGVQMVSILRNGSEGLRALREEAAKLNEQELANLKKLHDDLEGAAGTLKKWAAGAVEVWAGFWRDLGAHAGGGSDTINQVILRKQAKAAAEQLAQAKAEAARIEKEKKDEKEADKQISATIEQEAKYAKEDEEAAKRTLELTKQRAEQTDRILNASRALIDAQKAIIQQREDRSGHTLAEVAESRFFTAQGRRNVIAAQVAQRAEDFAKQARIEGRTDLAKSATDFALNIRARLNALTGSEQRPLASMEESAAKSAERLQELLEKFTDGTAVVTAQGGD